MNISEILIKAAIIVMTAVLPMSPIRNNLTSTSNNVIECSETTECTEIVETTTEEEVLTFTAYYIGKNSKVTAETEVEVGTSFTLPEISDSSLKGWYLFKEFDGKLLYYAFNALGELDWRHSEDIVAYYVFYGKDKLDSTSFTSGESLYFQEIYAKKSIEDAVTSKWKGFEPYTAITNQNTLNHHIAYGKEYITPDGTVLNFDTKTDNTTGIRYVLIDNARYYCVALGSYYGKVGSRHLVVLDNHTAFKIIVTDNKSTKDAVCKKVDGKTFTIYHNKTGVFPVKNQHEYVEFVIDSNIVTNGHPAYKYGCLNVPFVIYDGNIIGI